MELLELIIYTFMSIWGAYITYLMFELFFDTSHISIKKKILLFGAYNAVTEIVYFGFNIPMLTFGVNIICFIIIGLIYANNIKKLLIAIPLIILVGVGGEGIALSIVKFENFYLFKDNPLVSLEIVFLTRVTTYFIALILIHFKNIKSENEISIKNNIIVIGISIISFYVIIILIGHREIGVLWRTISIVGMVIVSVGIFYLYNSINEYISVKMEKVLYQKESEYYKNQLSIIDKSIEQDKKMRHDMKNNLTNIQFLIEDGNLSEVKSYISTLHNHYKTTKRISKTGVNIIDSILNYKLEQAEHKFIKYTLNTTIPNDLNINSFDVGIILSNMLDNAIEALEKIPKDERNLDITISYEMESIKIIVENSYNGKIKLKNNKIVTSKEDKINHGYGIKSIKNAVDKYGGYMNIENKNNKFIISAIILENQP